MGSVFKQKKSRFWWIQYYRNGMGYRESTKIEIKGPGSLSYAKRMLRSKEGEVADGKIPNLQASRTTVDDLIRLYLKDREDNNRKAINGAKRSAELLGEHFGSMPVANVTTEELMDYRAKRRRGWKARSGKVEDSTINRELSVLRRMYNLGRKHNPPLVNNPLPITLIKENNVRLGFFEHDEFLALRGVLPDHLKVVASIGYYTGMRLGRILSLRWDQIDWDHGMIRLDPGTETKKVGHVPLIPQLEDVLLRWSKITNTKWPHCPWVCHYAGHEISEIKRGWKTACKKVGLEKKLFHDFRRSACRNLIRAGIPQSIAMKISGHKTYSVFDRYNIVSEEDVKAAGVKLSGYMQVQSENLEKHSNLNIPEEFRKTKKP